MSPKILRRTLSLDLTREEVEALQIAVPQRMAQLQRWATAHPRLTTEQRAEVDTDLTTLADIFSRLGTL